QPRFQIVEVDSFYTNLAIQGMDSRGCFLLDREAGQVWMWKFLPAKDGHPGSVGWFRAPVEGIP
ncbi:MAG TPA: hypothetical protein VMY87_05105, partial [Armatimonadota bacterium]|nr:hypothetical protein [Armatimonadota bacterium]